MSRNFLEELAQLKTQLSEYADDYRENEADDKRIEEFKQTLLAILRKIVGVVHDAERDKAVGLPDVVETAESLLNEAVSLAYEGSDDDEWQDRSLFTSLESFAHTEEYPLAKPAREGQGVFCESSTLFTDAQPNDLRMVFWRYSPQDGQNWSAHDEDDGRCVWYTSALLGRHIS